MQDKTPGELELVPLDIRCTSTDCDNGLHCFLATRKMVTEHTAGRCRECGTDLVDWDRVHRCDIGDSANTFGQMRCELIRHHFWHKPLDEKATNYARRKGKRGMREAVERRIRRSVGPASPYRDGRQTPMDGSVIYFAQHATACCCRRCIEEWHGIPRGQELTNGQIEYLSQLAILYVEARLPDLKEEGEHVPPVRRGAQATGPGREVRR